jgi:hypothetical protein
LRVPEARRKLVLRQIRFRNDHIDKSIVSVAKARRGHYSRRGWWMGMQEG